MPPEPVVEFDKVCFGYGSQEVLHNVAFQIAPREMVAVVGPNGGGKTTLLMLTLGLIVPRMGRVRVFGGSPLSARRRVGYVPQHAVFDAKFPVTAMDVVLMGRVDRRAMGFYSRADRDSAAQALAQVQLEHMARRSFASLSGGERQRVLMAQALVTDPDLLLLDEPTANVDSRAEHALFQLFGELRKQRTIVMVSHNLNVVTRHADRVLCVNRTAGIHAIGEVTSSVFQESFGGDLAVLQHDVTCHVINSSAVLESPHLGEAPGREEPSAP